MNAKPVKLPHPMDFDDLMRRVVRVKPDHQKAKAKAANGKRSAKAKR